MNVIAGINLLLLLAGLLTFAVICFLVLNMICWSVKEILEELRSNKKRSVVVLLFIGFIFLIGSTW